MGIHNQLRVCPIHGFVSIFISGASKAKKYNFHYVSLVSKSSPENKVVVELPGGRMIKLALDKVQSGGNLGTLP